MWRRPAIGRWPASPPPERSGRPDQALGAGGWGAEAAYFCYRSWSVLPGSDCDIHISICGGPGKMCVSLYNKLGTFSVLLRLSKERRNFYE